MLSDIKSSLNYPIHLGDAGPHDPFGPSGRCWATAANEVSLAPNGRLRLAVAAAAA